MSQGKRAVPILRVYSVLYPLLANQEKQRHILRVIEGRSLRDCSTLQRACTHMMGYALLCIIKDRNIRSGLTQAKSFHDEFKSIVNTKTNCTQTNNEAEYPCDALG